VLGRVWDRRRVVLRAACPAEACTATASGRLSIEGTTKSIRLGTASAWLARGSPGGLELRLSAQGWRRARRALAAQKTVRLRIDLTARDGAGNATTARQSLKRTRL
jgi:hypothetical protein